jgi:hypothetical protein
MLKNYYTNSEMRSLLDLGNLICVVVFTTHVSIDKNQLEDWMKIDFNIRRERESVLDAEAVSLISDSDRSFYKQLGETQWQQYIRIKRIDFVELYGCNKITGALLSVTGNDYHLVNNHIHQLEQEWLKQKLSIIKIAEIISEC